jgi:hypothetical protein
MTTFDVVFSLKLTTRQPRRRRRRGSVVCMLSSRRMVPRHGEVWRLPPPPPHPPASPSRPPLGHERGYTPAPCNLRSSQTEITHLRPVCECGVWVLWGEINFLKKQSSKCLATSFSIIGYCSSNKIGQPEWRVWIFLQVSCQWKENQSWVKDIVQPKKRGV